jgi:glycine betaine/proline transport system substrate-binding protein
MIALEEPAYDKAIWDSTGACAYPAVHVNIVVNSGFPERAPEIAQMLRLYATTTEENNKALAYMQENKASTEDAAIWFLKNFESSWAQWVPADIAKKVKDALSR